MRPLAARVTLAGLGLVLSLVPACGGPGPTGIADAPAASGPRPATPPVPVAAGDWPTYHRDNTRTGVAMVPPAGPLSRAWAARLDGAVYGQPVVIGDRVVAATENDTVYALARSDGHVLWSAHLGAPETSSNLPCGNISPLGITSTPAYDPGTGLVFVVAETRGGHHALVGLDLVSGAAVLHRPVEPPRGDPLAHQQRAALTVLGNAVYIAYGGLFGDCGDYVGSVVAAPTSGLGPLRSYAVPTAERGGIWAPGGATVDGGRLLYPVGNGQSDAGYDYSDSITALTPDLTRADHFSPLQWADDNDNDLDLGSMSPALVEGHVYADGKRGLAYVLNAGQLGGVGGQAAQQPICRAFGGTAVAGSTVYVPCPDGTRAVDVSPSGRAMARWKAPVDADGSPVVGGGAVWVPSTSQGVLYALDPATGRPRQQIAVGSLPHFASPTLVGNRAYLGTRSGVVAIDGI